MVVSPGGIGGLLSGLVLWIFIRIPVLELMNFCFVGSFSEMIRFRSFGSVVLLIFERMGFYALF